MLTGQLVVACLSRRSMSGRRPCGWLTGWIDRVSAPMLPAVLPSLVERGDGGAGEAPIVSPAPGVPVPVSPEVHAEVVGLLREAVRRG